jgi:hypothetical protein
MTPTSINDAIEFGRELIPRTKARAINIDTLGAVNDGGLARGKPVTLCSNDGHRANLRSGPVVACRQAYLPPKLFPADGDTRSGKSNCGLISDIVLINAVETCGVSRGRQLTSREPNTVHR